MKRFFIIFIIGVQIFLISLFSIQQFRENREVITSLKAEVIDSEGLKKEPSDIYVYRYGKDEYIYIDEEDYSYDIINADSRRKIDKYIDWHDTETRYFIIKVIAVVVLGCVIIFIVWWLKDGIMFSVLFLCLHN